MLRVEVRVGMPTTKEVFALVGATLEQLLSYKLREGLDGHIEELADKLEWAVAATLETLDYQPIAKCYAARFGIDKLARLARRAELCVLAALLKRYAARSLESEEEYLERMLSVGSSPEQQVYH